MKNVRERFGRHLRELRERRELTQEDLARASGLNRVFIGEVERGERSAGLDSLIKLARGLGLDLRDLFDFDEAGTSPRRKLAAHEQLALKIGNLAQAAPASEIKRFEEFGLVFFRPWRPPRRGGVRKPKRG